MSFGGSVHALSAYLRCKWLSITNRLSRSPLTKIGGPVVSLTSYSSRIRTVHLTIESIARGARRPSRLILWLDEVNVVNDPTPGLKRLIRRGLEIRLCKNYGPHKKYFPFVCSETRFDVPLVTADDDVLYPTYWLRDLCSANAKDPQMIHCFRARVMSFAGGRLSSYAEWQLCETQRPMLCNVAIGTSGIIYPPRFLAQLKRAGEDFSAICPRADDLWLHVQELRAGFKVRQVRARALLFPFIPGTQKAALWNCNIDGGENDAQIRATYDDKDLVALREEQWA